MATCRWCGDDGLEWVNQQNAGWELRDEHDFIHHCDETKLLKKQNENKEQANLQKQAVVKAKTDGGYLA